MTAEQTRVDVLRRDALHAEAYRLAHGYVGGTLADARKESDAAIAAVTELLAADREFDSIVSRYGYGPEINAVSKRRAAALSAFAPQRAEQEES